MAGMEIPVKAQFSGAEIDAALQSFRDQINRLGEQIARLNKMEFNPIDKASLDDMRRLNSQFEQLLKLQGDFRRRMKETGQAGAGFFDLDWQKMYPDATSRARAMRQKFDYVTHGIGPASLLMGSPGAVAAVPGGARVPTVAQPSQFAIQGRNIAHSALGAMGPVGGAVGRGLSAGMAGGVTAGLAGLAGGLVALGIGQAIGAVRERFGAAQNEMIEYDTLKRVLGDVNVSFKMLEDSLRASSRGLDLTFEQGQRLGMEFAKVSGMVASQASSLASEVYLAGGFSRSFGLDPSEGTRFFAEMRHMGVTDDVQGSRRLAVDIAEAIARSGTFSKADEVLQAISSFTVQQTRLGLTSANVGGYTGLFASMVGAKIPGLDPVGAANLLSRVNQSIASGGGGGEAGQNFLFSALGARLGLDPIQTMILQEQGAFGTGRGTFGSGSLFARFAQQYGMSTPGAAGSDATNLQLIMERLRSNYGSNPAMMLNAMTTLFGVNHSQAMALATMNPMALGGLQSRLQANGIRMEDVNATGLSRIAQIEADGSLSEEQKNRMIAEAARQNQESTLGSETRSARVALENLAQEVATKLIPAVNMMRDGILFLAGADKGRGPMAIARAVREAESGERRQAIRQDFDRRLSGASDQYNALVAERAGILRQMGEARRSRTLTPEAEQAMQARVSEISDQLAYADEDRRRRVVELSEERRQALAAEDARLQSQLRELDQYAIDSLRTTPGTGASVPPAAAAAAGGAAASAAARGGAPMGSPEVMAALAETDRVLGLPPGTSAAQIAQESSFNPNAVSRAGAMGLAQVMPATLRSLERRFGRQLDPFNPMDAVMIHREVMRENLGRFGNVPDAMRAYNGGWDPSRWGNQETSEYVDRVMARVPLYATGMPQGVSAPSAPGEQRVAVDVSGRFSLEQGGREVAAPVQVATRVGVPTPYGAR